MSRVLLSEADTPFGYLVHDPDVTRISSRSIGVEDEDIIQRRSRRAPVGEDDEPLGRGVVEVRVRVAVPHRDAVTEHRCVVAVHELHALELESVETALVRATVAVDRDSVQHPHHLPSPAALAGARGREVGEAVLGAHDDGVLLLVSEPAHEPAVHEGRDAGAAGPVHPADQAVERLVRLGRRHEAHGARLETELRPLHPPDVHQIELRGQLLSEIIDVVGIGVRAPGVMVQVVTVPVALTPQEEEQVRVERPVGTQDRSIALGFMIVVAHHVDPIGRQRGPLANRADDARQPDPAVVPLDDLIARAIDLEVAGVARRPVVDRLELRRVYLSEAPGIRRLQQPLPADDEVDCVADRGTAGDVIDHRLGQERRHLRGIRRVHQTRQEPPLGSGVTAGLDRDLHHPLGGEACSVTAEADVERNRESGSHQERQRQDHEEAPVDRQAPRVPLKP